jgi:hypothetical protein
MQPGQTIQPGVPPTKEAQPQPQPTTPPVDTPAPEPQPPVAPEQAPQPEASPETPWHFSADQQANPVDAASVPQATPVSWTASEYVAHNKGVSWFLLVGLAIVVVAVAIYALTRDVVSAVVIGIVGVTFGAFGARKPQVLEYIVDSKGIHIGHKTYPYVQFRSFSVLEDDGTHSIFLMPAQRFGLPINIYYELKDEGTIVEALGANLPLEERKAALIDRLMSKIRF